MKPIRQFKYHALVGIIGFILICSPSTSYSQNRSVTTQQLIWLFYYNTISFSKKYFLSTEIFERRYIEGFKSHQSLIRTHFHRKLNDHFDGALGFTLFLQRPHDPNSNSSFAIPELRPHIELNYKFHTEKFNFHSRLRFENRNFRNAANNELIDGYNTNYRIRLLVSADVPMVKFKNTQTIKLKLTDEIHFSAGGVYESGKFDQNRIGISLNVDITKNLSFETGYLNWYQKRPGIDAYYNRHIIRIGINHKINLKKEKSDG